VRAQRHLWRRAQTTQDAGAARSHVPINAAAYCGSGGGGGGGSSL